MQPSPHTRGLGLRTHFLSRPPLGSLALRPGDSLTIPKMALSVGFIRFVSSTDATRATGLLTLALVGLIPTEHVCLVWTHSCAKTRPIGLGGFAVVELEQAAQPRTTRDRACADRRRLGRNEGALKPGEPERMRQLLIPEVA
jgi:hypothetical protein